MKIHEKEYMINKIGNWITIVNKEIEEELSFENGIINHILDLIDMENDYLTDAITDYDKIRCPLCIHPELRRKLLIRIRSALTEIIEEIEELYTCSLSYHSDDHNI